MAESTLLKFLNEVVLHRFDLWFVFAVGLVFLAWMRREKNLPPGPTGLPLVGYLPFLGQEAFKTLYKLSLTYGPIFSFHLGRQLVVVLGSFRTVKEALSNSDIMDRPKNPPNHLLPNSTNMSISNGHVWKEQRQFSIQMLRQLGMGKTAMEDMIQEELRRLMREIDSKEGRPMNLSEILIASVSNNMVTLLTGRTLNYTDKDRIFLNDMLKTMTLYFRPTRIHAYFPSVKFWMAKLGMWGYDKVERYMEKLGKFLDDQIEAHKKTFDSERVRDYIDGYLLTMKEKGKENSTFTDKMLKGNIQSLLGAGSTPARATVEWALVSMVEYPEVQKAVHEELDSVIGRDRLPTWLDNNNVPYTMAVLYEVMRQYTIIPISMLRSNSKRCKIMGYDIPKGTVIMTNIWGVHHDPDYWKDPFCFQPERFLKDGKVVKPSAFIPFSYGKRNCPGEDMALVEVFLYFTTLMQRYSITSPNENEQCYQKVLGIANMVIPDNICMNIRN